MRRKLRQVEIYYALSGSIRRGLVSRPRSPSVRRSKYKLVSFIRIGPHPNPLGSQRDWQRVQYLFVVCGVTPAEPELTNRERQQHRCYQYAERYRHIFLLTDQSQVPYHRSSQLSHFGGISVTYRPRLHFPNPFLSNANHGQLAWRPSRLCAPSLTRPRWWCRPTGRPCPWPESPDSPAPCGTGRTPSARG